MEQIMGEKITKNNAYTHFLFAYYTEMNKSDTLLLVASYTHFLFLKEYKNKVKNSIFCHETKKKNWKIKVNILKKSKRQRNIR
jgi:hypothetical protein